MGGVLRALQAGSKKGNGGELERRGRYHCSIIYFPSYKINEEINKITHFLYNTLDEVSLTKEYEAQSPKFVHVLYEISTYQSDIQSKFKPRPFEKTR